MMTVKEYIAQSIGNTVCFNPLDEGKLLGLPLPYSVPTVGETFHALFYWDTYFTNLALLSLGDIEQAKNNIEDFAALIDRLGFIPNGNKQSLCDRSQPPFFALMVRDVFAVTGDTAWLAHIYPYLCREHDFWMKERSLANGLAHYGTAVLPDREEKYALAYSRRIGVDYTPETQKMLAENFLAQAESGWDFNARFGFDSIRFCPVDLNSLLWALEHHLSEFAALLQNGEAEKWQAAADARAAAMRAFLKDESGAFRDRSAATGAFSDYICAASFYPLFVGLATPEEAKATLALLPRLMHEWGVVPCEPARDGRQYQWGAPNGWPCLQVIAADGLRRYGYAKEADVIARKYVTMVDRVFAETGALWEKYNLDTGSNDAVNEYKMPEMLGWTAGAYLHFNP